MILHGGFWRDLYDRTYIRPLADDLTTRGYAAWSLEFRRMGPPNGEGGYPMTLDDVATGIDHVDELAVEYDLDLTRVALIGHSAGGHLSLWAAGRANALVTPMVAIALAGVADLRLSYDMGLGEGAVELFMGGTPGELPDDYAMADPGERLPTGVAQVLVHGLADVNVPIDVARRYFATAQAAGDDVELLEFDTDHMEVVNPRHESWAAVVQRLP